MQQAVLTLLIIVAAASDADVAQSIPCVYELRPATGQSTHYGEVEFEAGFVDGAYQLVDCRRGIVTMDARNSTDLDDARPVISLDGRFFANGQHAAVSVHWAAQRFHDYLGGIFGWQGQLAGDEPLRQYVHFGEALFNAVHDDGVIIYGDGGAYNSTAIVSADYVGHEMSHAVIMNTARLAYFGESGALNESFADILARAFSHHLFGEDAGWEMFADIYRDHGMSTRSLSQPDTDAVPRDRTAEAALRWRAAQGLRTVYQTTASTYLGSGWNFDWSDQALYTNAGPNNRWFYLLSEGEEGVNEFGREYAITGIGVDAAAQIVWRTLTEYLPPDADYLSVRYGSEQAAIDLYGTASPQLSAVQAAWDAVEVTEENYGRLARFARELVALERISDGRVYNAAFGEGFVPPPGLEHQGEGSWYVHSSSLVPSYEAFLGYQNWTAIGGQTFEIRFTSRGGHALFVTPSSDREVREVPFEVWALGADLDDPADDVRLAPIVFDIDANGEFGIFQMDRTGWGYTADHPAFPGTADVWTDMIHIAAPANAAPGEAAYLDFAAHGREAIAVELLRWLAFVSPDAHATDLPDEGDVFRIVFSRQSGRAQRPEPRNTLP